MSFFLLTQKLPTTQQTQVPAHLTFELTFQKATLQETRNLGFPELDLGVWGYLPGGQALYGYHPQQDPLPLRVRENNGKICNI